MPFISPKSWYHVVEHNRGGDGEDDLKSQRESLPFSLRSVVLRLAAMAAFTFALPPLADQFETTRHFVGPGSLRSLYADTPRELIDPGDGAAPLDTDLAQGASLSVTLINAAVLWLFVSASWALLAKPVRAAAMTVFTAVALAAILTILSVAGNTLRVPSVMPAPSCEMISLYPFLFRSFGAMGLFAVIEALGAYTLPDEPEDSKDRVCCGRRVCTASWLTISGLVGQLIVLGVTIPLFASGLAFRASPSASVISWTLSFSGGIATAITCVAATVMEVRTCTRAVRLYPLAHFTAIRTARVLAVVTASLTQVTTGVVLTFTPAPPSDCPAYMFDLELPVPSRRWPYPCDGTNDCFASVRSAVSARSLSLWTGMILFLVSTVVVILAAQANVAATREADARRATDRMRQALQYISHEARAPLGGAILSMSLLDDAVAVTDAARANLLISDLHLSLEAAQRQLTDLLVFDEDKAGLTDTLSDAGLSDEAMSGSGSGGGASASWRWVSVGDEELIGLRSAFAGACKAEGIELELRAHLPWAGVPEDEAVEEVLARASGIAPEAGLAEASRPADPEAAASEPQAKVGQSPPGAVNPDEAVWQAMAEAEADLAHVAGDGVASLPPGANPSTSRPEPIPPVPAMPIHQRTLNAERAGKETSKRGSQGSGRGFLQSTGRGRGSGLPALSARSFRTALKAALAEQPEAPHAGGTRRGRVSKVHADGMQAPPQPDVGARHSDPDATAEAEVFVDLDRVLAIAQNALSNSIKHAPGGGSGAVAVSLTLGPESDLPGREPRRAPRPDDRLAGRPQSNAGTASLARGATIGLGQAASLDGSAASAAGPLAPGAGSIRAAQSVRIQADPLLGLPPPLQRRVLWIEVLDNGRGIPAPLLRPGRLFRPFQQLRQGDGSLRMTSSGLGLSIVKSVVVEQLHGVVGLASKEGEGTLFVAKVPVWARRSQGTLRSGPPIAGAGARRSIPLGIGGGGGGSFFAGRTVHSRSDSLRSGLSSAGPRDAALSGMRKRGASAGPAPIVTGHSELSGASVSSARTPMRASGKPDFFVVGAADSAGQDATDVGDPASHPPSAVGPTALAAKASFRAESPKALSARRVGASAAPSGAPGDEDDGVVGPDASSVQPPASAGPRRASVGRQRRPQHSAPDPDSRSTAGTTGDKASTETSRARSRQERAERRQRRRQDRTRGGARAGAADSKAGAGAAAAPAESDKRVAFVVDDERVNRTLLARLLRGWGFATVEMDDGTGLVEAVRELVAQGKGGRWPSVVTLDIQMPGIDGFGSLEALAKLEAETRAAGDSAAADRVRGLVVIGVTGNAVARDRERMLRLGARAVLTKPVDPSRLAKQIETSGRFKLPPRAHRRIGSTS